MQKYILMVVIFGVSIMALTGCDSGGAAAPNPTATVAAASTAPASTATSAPTATTAPAAPGPAPTARATTVPGPVNTPNNTVPTVDPKAANTSFQTAKAIGKDPIKLSFKDSEFYYKLDIARGGIVSATLSVDAFSPEAARMSLYDEKQNYLNEITVPVARSGPLKHIFGNKGGGTVYLVLKGNSSATLIAQALTQNDGGTKGDAGDDFDSAVTVPLGQISGLLGDDDHEDDFIVDLAKSGGVLNVSLKATDGNIKLAVYDESRNYINEISADKNKPEPGVLQHVLAVGQGGRWYLALTGSGSYTLNAAFGAQNDGGSGKDAGGDFDSALTIKTGSFTGLVGGPDTDDFYGFELPKTGGVLAVSLRTTDGNVKWSIYDDGRNYSADLSSDKSKTTASSFRYVLAGTQGGRWFLDVSGEGSYAFTLSFVPQDDGGSGKDAGDSADTSVVPKTSDFTGTLGNADAADYFKVPAALGRKLNVQYPSGEGALKIALYDKDDNYLKDASINKGETVDMVEDSGLTTDYFIVISGGNGDYRIKLTR